MLCLAGNNESLHGRIWSCSPKYNMYSDFLNLFVASHINCYLRRCGCVSRGCFDLFWLLFSLLFFVSIILRSRLKLARQLVRFHPLLGAYARKQHGNVHTSNRYQYTIREIAKQFRLQRNNSWTSSLILLSEQFGDDSAPWMLPSAMKAYYIIFFDWLIDWLTEDKLLRRSLSLAECKITLLGVLSCRQRLTLQQKTEAGFPLPELTARQLTRLVETRARQHGPCWRVMETGHPSTRAVNSGRQLG